jgi:hypothetical protein
MAFTSSARPESTPIGQMIIIQTRVFCPRQPAGIGGAKPVSDFFESTTTADRERWTRSALSDDCSKQIAKLLWISGTDICHRDFE